MENLICDICGQVFSKDYFCPQCSNKVIIEQVEGTRDESPTWDGDSRFADYPILYEEEIYTGNVCYNCCTCKIVSQNDG